MVVEVTGDGELASVEGGVADTDHAVVGLDHDGDEVATRTAEHGSRLLNLHRVPSLSPHGTDRARPHRGLDLTE